MEFRLNINTQIRGYYSLMFAGEYDLSPNHTSLYMFLLNQNNRTYWSEWFKCPFDLAMMGAGIHSKGTYYKILKDLERFKLIEYRRGINDYKAPKIKICDLSSVSNSVPQSEPLSEPLNSTATVPLPEPLPIPLVVPLPTPLPTHIYKLLTSNLKLITDNIEEVVKFLENKSQSTIDYKFILDNYHTLCPKMSKVLVLNDTRKGYINARVGEYGLEKVISVLRMAGQSDFLNGINDKAWKADFEWIVRPENFVKVMEGKYVNKKPVTAKAEFTPPVKILTENSR